MDCIIFGFDDNIIKLFLFKWKVDLLVGEWFLIGSFVWEEEGVNYVVVRVLEEYIGLENVYMEELGCFGEVGCDLGVRVFLIVYLVLIWIGEYDVDLVEWYGVKWFDYD